MLKQILNRFHPLQKPVENNDAKMLGILAATPDASPLYNAMQDHLHEQFCGQISVALNFHSTDEHKLRALERAAALFDTASVLEDTRKAAVADAAMKQEQAKNQS